MKIAQLLNGIGLAVTNEESQFIEKYGDRIRLTTLDERAQWIAQNLVRKGVYSISNDDNTLVKDCNEDIP